MSLQSNNLFNIQLQYLELMKKIEEAEGELTAELEFELTWTQQQLQEAAINMGYVYLTFEYNEEVLKAEIERLTNLKHKVTKSRELLKNRLSESMQHFGIEKIESPTLKLSFRKSKAVEILDEKLIPAAYLNQPPPKPDKTAIKEAIVSGLEVPGAAITERQNLQIK